jgi:FkbM family methyltransferase
MTHINYFDMGLCYDAAEMHLFVEHVVPQFKNVTYSVYGFEADPDSANVIKDRYKNNPNVHIENIAISNSKGNVKLYKSDNGGLGNSIFPSKNNVDPFKFYEVDSNTFSNWLLEKNINLDNCINILKVNIEGAELYLWEDFKQNNLRNKFHILCGTTVHDINKVRELSTKVQYYHELVKELNAELSVFTGNHSQKSVHSMSNLIKNILNP